MKIYIGARIFKAEPMTKTQFLTEQRKAHHEDEDWPTEGYKVVYPDGYINWCPKKVFEIAYRELTEGEKAVL